MIAAEVLEPGTNLFGVFGAADVIILGIVLASAAIGFWSGFIWMLVLVVGMVACIWVTLVYHPVVARAFGSHFTQPMRLMGSAAAVFIGAILVCYLVAFLFRDIINALKPQLADRILGAVFGVILGVCSRPSSVSWCWRTPTRGRRSARTSSGRFPPGRWAPASATPCRTVSGGWSTRPPTRSLTESARLRPPRLRLSTPSSAPGPGETSLPGSRARLAPGA